MRWRFGGTSASKRWWPAAINTAFRAGETTRVCKRSIAVTPFRPGNVTHEPHKRESEPSPLLKINSPRFFAVTPCHSRKTPRYRGRVGWHPIALGRVDPLYSSTVCASSSKP